MEIRDRIHGLVEYNDVEEAALNSQALQRLRRVRQLALAEYVYPSGGHSRFEHVIGVMHLAGLMARKFGLSDSERQTVRLAALLHDVGHLPFSHTSELVLNKYTPPETLKGKEIETIHEAVTLDMLSFDEELIRVVGESVLGRVRELIRPGPRILEKEIVSGPLDADKLDYIRRDAHQAGVSYGVFDQDKVLESLVPVRISGAECSVGILEDGVWAVEQLLLAKYHMNAQVYRHRIRRITDSMLVRGLSLAIQEGLPELKQLYRYEQSSGYCKFFLRFDDDTLMRVIRENSKGNAKEMFDRLYSRCLFKEVFGRKVDTSSFPDTVKLRALEKMNEEKTRQIEVALAEKLGLDADFVILDKQSLTNPTFRYPEREIRPDTIMVQMRDNTRRAFNEVSGVFQNPVIGPSDQYLYVYAPLDSLSRQDRERRIGEQDGQIYGIIDKHLA